MVLLFFFVVATVAWTAVSLLLSLRQSAYVARHRSSVPEDFADAITAAEHAKAADYTVARERLARAETLVGAALSLGWALGGIALLYAAVAALVPPGLGRGVLFFVGTAVVGMLVDLPFAVVRAFVVEKRFGFNRTSPATFLADLAKRVVLSAVIGLPLLVLVLWAMRAATGLWWLYAWIAALAIMLAAPTIFVRFVAPRFNRFDRLEDGPLRQRIEARLVASGFTSSGLFTMDASKRSTHGNAFFIGFGRTKRIVLFDTLIARSTPEEIEAVVAHELGHFLHKHVLFGIVRGAAVLLGVLAAIGWLSHQTWLLPSFGLTRGDVAVRLYVCALLLSMVGPLMAPIGNWLSRRNEYQADDYARRSVGIEPMVHALTRLSRDNASTLTPDPWYALAHYSHPTVPLRVRHMRAMQAGA